MEGLARRPQEPWWHRVIRRSPMAHSSYPRSNLASSGKHVPRLALSARPLDLNTTKEKQARRRQETEECH